MNSQIPGWENHLQLSLEDRWENRVKTTSWVNGPYPSSVVRSPHGYVTRLFESANSAITCHSNFKVLAIVTARGNLPQSLMESIPTLPVFYNFTNSSNDELFQAYCINPPSDSCDFGPCPNPDVTGVGQQVSRKCRAFSTSKTITFS